MTTRTWTVIGLIVAAIPILFAYNLYVFLYESIPEMYCAEWVAGTIIHHMKTNDGGWPRDWDELRRTYADRTKDKGGPWSFEDLHRWVDVDFSADPGVLAQATLPEHGPPFRVVTLKSGRRHYWEGAEPNTMIWRYLQKPESIPTEEESTH